jgi:hypothetical protein
MVYWFYTQNLTIAVTKKPVQFSTTCSSIHKVENCAACALLYFTDLLTLFAHSSQSKVRQEIDLVPHVGHLEL